MSNPPTFNDLKRARNLYNSQQRNKILLGSSIPLKFRTPSLTVPDFTFNFLSIDNNYVVTGDELGANGNQFDLLNAKKFISYPLFEFYNKHRFITSTDYLFDSLYFLNDKFRQKSINFNDTIDDVGEITFERKFFNYNSEIETQSVTLTSYDFSNLQVNLSSDVVGFSGDNDTTSFTIKLSSSIDNGRLLDNFLNYSLDDSFNLSATSFNDLSAFKRLPEFPTNYDPFEYDVNISDLSANESFTITLSTNRNDGKGVNTSTKTFTFDVSAAPYTEARANSIHTVWTTVSSLSNPLDEYPTLSGELLVDTQEARKSLFSDDGGYRLWYQNEFFRPDANLHYSDALDNEANEAIRTKYRYVNDRTTDSANYNTAWYLYPYRSIYDLTGISLRGDNNITLINGKFGLSNTHFGGATNPGSIARFLTTENKIVSATVVGELNLGRDANLIKLSNDITTEAAAAGGTVKTYKLPLFNNRVKKPKVFPTLSQAGNSTLGKLRNPEFTGSFAYGEGDEFAALGATKDLAVNAPLSGAGSGAFIGYVSLQSVSSVFEGKKLGFPQRSLQSGDSSSPNFIIHNNELLLFTTNYATSYIANDGATSGPGYETQGMHDRITDGMEALGREGYQLSAVQLD